jgi:hypothetical protein
MPIAFSSATAAGKDLPLAIGIPAGRAELNGRVGESVDRFYPALDECSAIGAVACRSRFSATFLKYHDMPPSCWAGFVGCTPPT